MFDSSETPSTKVKYIHSCGLQTLTKNTENDGDFILLYDCIKAVSHHKNSKAFSSYQNWYQIPIFKKVCGYKLYLKYFFARENCNLPIPITNNLTLIKGFIKYYNRFV